MPSADKRARKKENARAAREVREAAFRRKKRTRSTVSSKGWTYELDRGQKSIKGVNGPAA